MTFAALQAALDTNNDAAVAAALDAIGGHVADRVVAIDLVLGSLRRRGVAEHTMTSWQYRLAQALEDAAHAEQPSPAAASAFAVRAAHLQRDVLNDGEGTTRALVLALLLATDDVAAMREAVDAAGGPEPAVVLLEKAAKRAKGDDGRIGRLRRALARIAEVVLRDPERAFFEALKAARKLPTDGLAVDEVYRLALETKRLDEAAAFFHSLADDVAMAPRVRATAGNKLGAILEEKGDGAAAFNAYVASLRHFETRAARRKAERLQEQLELATPLPEPVPAAAELPAPSPAADRPADRPVVVTADAAGTAPGSLSLRPPAMPAEDQRADVDADDADVDAGQHIVSEEAAPSDFDVRPPTLAAASVAGPAGVIHRDGGVDVDVDVDRDPSMAVERFDLTSEQPPVAATMTMQPTLGLPSEEEPSLHVLVAAAPPARDDSLVQRLPGSLVGEGPLPAPSVPMSSSSSSSSSAARPLHAGFVMPTGPFEHQARPPSPSPSSSSSPSSPSELTPPPMPPLLSQEEAVLHQSLPAAPTVAGPARAAEVTAVMATPRASGSARHGHASEELGGRKKAKKSKGAKRRGHEVHGATESTTPAGRLAPGSALDATVPGSVPIDEPSSSQADALSWLSASPSSPPAHEPSPLSLVDAPSESASPEVPLALPALPAANLATATAPSPREQVLARAVELLAPTATDTDADVVDFLTCAEELAALIPGDPRVLRLAGRALVLSAPSGILPEGGCDLIQVDASRHGDRAASVIREVQQALPPERRGAYPSLWLAGARAAGHDVDTIHALLEEGAADDAPDGPLFTHLDAVLRDAGDLDRRDVLHLRGWRVADRAGDDVRKVAILRRRVEMLEAARRDGPAMQAWTQLTLEHTTDQPTREAARRFLEHKATPEERARFLARLARKLDGAEALAVLHELLAVRVSVDDRVGAEATARDVLGRVPGDARAVAALVDLLADDPRRAAELVDVLQQRIELALRDADPVAARTALERLARACTQLDRVDDAAAALMAAARLAPGDAGLVQRVVDSLMAVDRVADAVDLLDELATDAPLGTGGRLWFRAAELCRGRLKRLGRARELLEKAVAADDSNVAALDAHAELLIELGDAEGALLTLERLLAVEPEGKARSRVQLRLGQLLEQHLQRDDDALTNYRAALDGDRALVPAWEALHGLARRRGDRAGVAEALMGLAGLQTGRARAHSLVKLGRLQQERADFIAAATAFEGALAADPADVDAVTGLIGVRARVIQGESDVEAALAIPAPELVDEVFPHLLAVEAAGAMLPFALRRLLALGVTQTGNSDDARVRFEALLEERGDDLPTLLAFARHLGHAARQLDPGRNYTANILNSQGNSALPRSGSPGLAAAADERRREVLEAVLLHHAYALKPAIHLDVWGEVCVLRLQQGDRGGAKKAAKKALSLLAAGDPRLDLDHALSDRAVRACVLALEDGVTLVPAPAVDGVDGVDSSDIEQLELALRLDLQRAMAPSEKARLKEKQARIAVIVRSDVVAARLLLTEALQHDPDLSSARESLFDLELSGEDPRAVLERSRALLASERDSHKKALLHLKLFRLQRKLKTSSLADDAAGAEIKAAVELAPRDPDILEAAEKFFHERKDARGLDDLFTARLKSLDRGDVVGRTALLDRLAQLRRYELRDLRGAIDACEAFSALDPDAIKPREDAARLHIELGQWKEGVAAWRAVIDRDTLMVDAWRGLFSVLARSRQADEAFAVAATMVALEIADDDMTRAVRAVRPPFPRWPIPPSDLTTFKKRLSHPLERTCVRAILEVVAPRLLPRMGRPLEDFGIHRRDAIAEAKLPPSVAMATRTAGALSGFRGAIALYRAEPGSTDGDSPAFAALPAREPGLLVTADVMRGGVTPERAFALGRAVAWLTPSALLAASMDVAEIRHLLESLVAAFLTPRDVERPTAALEAAGAELKRELLTGLGPTEQDALVQALLPALRDWVVARSRLQLADWKAGVGYSGDRLGFLLAGDVPAAVKVIRGAGASAMAMRLAIKELVLFSISQPYLQLRRELSLALPEQALAPVLDLG